MCIRDSILADEDLPWAQVMLDPSFGSAQGGIGGTIDLRGGETCFGFFLDGDDGQQPVVLGLLYRSDGVKNLMTDDVIAKEKGSQFKPFSGNPNPPKTQRDTIKEKEIDLGATTEERNNKSTLPITAVTAEQLTLEGKDINELSFSTDLGLNIDGVQIYQQQFGDKIAGVFKNNPAASLSSMMQQFNTQPPFVTPNGCENNLIGQITQGLQNFIAVTNGLDKYIGVYVDPILNEIVDIGNSIKSCARQIGGIVKLIINNLRGTIMKCIGWLFRKFVRLVIPQPQQKVVLEVMKKILDAIFCILEKLPGDILGFLEGLLGDLAANTINAPVCAVEQWTAGILAKIMDSIENALSTIMSGLSWLTGGLSTISGILNTASSLASQIFSFLECTGLACKTPSVWAAKFGPSEQEADNWKKMVDNVDVFKKVSKELGSIEDALQVTPLYTGINGINGRFNNLFSKCNEKVINPTSQEDIIPGRYKKCLPPIVRIVGGESVGIGSTVIPARATPIVDKDGSILSIRIDSKGYNYARPPAVMIVDNTGHGGSARAKAIIENGSISKIYVIDKGSGYCQGNYKIPEKNRIRPTIDSFTGIPPVGTALRAGSTLQLNWQTTNATEVSLTPSTNINTVLPVDGGITVKVPNTPGRSISYTLEAKNIRDSYITTASLTINYVIVSSEVPPDAQIPSTPLETQITPTIISFTGVPPVGTVLLTGSTLQLRWQTTNATEVSLTPSNKTNLLVNDSVTVPVSTTPGKISYTLEAKNVTKTYTTSVSETLFYDVNVVSKPPPGPEAPNPPLEQDSQAIAPVQGCITDIIVTAPGYGYLSSDTVTDGKNTYSIVVSPNSGYIVKVNIPSNVDLCGFDTIPDLTINTKTGIAANLIPILEYTPSFGITRAAVSGITTSVVDCV